MAETTLIICTLNPQADFLSTCLDSIAGQKGGDGAPPDFDVVIVDNNSQPEVELPPGRLGTYPFRVVVEPAAGLVAARLRGLRESSGTLLIYVDDDNVLSPDFVGRAGRIARTAPHLGAWGGWIDPVFPDGEPPAWVRPHLHLLAIKQPDQAVWSNQPFNYATTPVGAGLCVRRAVMEDYADLLQSTPWRRQLGRTGTELLSCEDLDIAYTAIDHGLGCGVFPELQLQHFLPARRLTPDYLSRLREGSGFSEILLQLGRGMPVDCDPMRLVHRLLNRYHRLRLPAHERQLQDAYARGRQRGLAWWQQQRTAGKI